MRTAFLFNFLVEANLIGSALIGLLALLRVPLRRVTGSRSLDACWGIVALRLLLPIALPNAWMNGLRPTLSRDGGVRPLADQIRVRVMDWTRGLHEGLLGGGSGDPIADLSGNLARSAGNGTLSLVLGAVWLTGFLVCLILMTRNALRFSRRVRREGSDAALNGRWPARLVPGLPGACLWGLRRPVALLPAEADAETRDVLYRLTCRRRGRWSILRVLLTDLCVCVHWFNPLVWLAARLCEADSQLACDERLCDSLEPEERERFGRLLTHLPTRPTRFPPRGCAATPAACGPRLMKTRIRRALHGRRPRWGFVAALAALCLMAVLAMFGTAEENSEGNVPALSGPVLAAGTMDTGEEAGRFACRFLSLQGIGAREPRADNVTLSGGVWTAELTDAAGENYQLSFTTEGRLRFFRSAAYRGLALHPLARQIGKETLEGRKWVGLVLRFFERNLPAQRRQIATAEVLSSGRLDAEQFLAVRLRSHAGAALWKVWLQITPEGRILSIEPAGEGD